MKVHRLPFFNQRALDESSRILYRPGRYSDRYRINRVIHGIGDIEFEPTDLGKFLFNVYYSGFLYQLIFHFRDHLVASIQIGTERQAMDAHFKMCC